MKIVDVLYFNHGMSDKISKICRYNLRQGVPAFISHIPATFSIDPTDKGDGSLFI